MIEEQARLSKIREIEYRAANSVKKDVKAATTRPDWMLTPPDSMRGLADKTSRKFSQKGKEDTSDHSVWTAAPADRAKAQLEANKRKWDEQAAIQPSAQDVLKKEQIKKVRGESLLDQHMKDYSTKTAEEVIPDRFDRERDIVTLTYFRY
jgi:Protein of unknown function (DUF3752)